MDLVGIRRIHTDTFPVTGLQQCLQRAVEVPSGGFHDCRGELVSSALFGHDAAAVDDRDEHSDLFLTVCVLERMEIQDDLGTVDVVFQKLAADAGGDHGDSVMLAHAHPALKNLQTAVGRRTVEEDVDVLLASEGRSELQFLGVFHRNVACTDSVGVEEVDVLDIVVPNFICGGEPCHGLVVEPGTALEELFEVVHDKTHAQMLLLELFRGKLRNAGTKDDHRVVHASRVGELCTEHGLHVGEDERIVVFDCKHIILGFRTGRSRSWT